MHPSYRSIVVACALVLAVGGAAAQDKKAEPPAMSAEEKAMMEKWMAFMTPGEPHKLLANRVGKWNLKVSMWQAPGAPVSTSEATCEVKPVFDGKYFEDTTTGTFMGQPFYGHGLAGYDNMKKKYFGAWIDNLGTGLMVSEGDYDPAAKTFTFMGKSPDVMTGKYIASKTLEKISGPDSWTMEMYNQTPDGKGWWKTMEIVYARQK